MRRALLFVALLLGTGLLPSPGRASTGTAAFAPVDPGVRAAALGGAFSALGGQPISMYWNPAGLYYQEDRSLEASYSSLYGLGLAKRTFLTLGVKSVLDQPRFRGQNVQVLEDRRTGPAYALGIQSLFLDVGDSGYSELSVGAAAAWGYDDRLAVGLSLRGLFVSSDFSDVSATGYDLGAGLTFRVSERERLALAAPNLISRLFWKFDTTERLPFRVVAGWARQWSRTVVTTAEAEWREGEDGPYRLAAGAEWWVFPDRLALRTGYRRLRGGLKNVSKPTFGAGVRFGKVTFDYAFRLEPDLLGDTHRIGILTRF